MPKIRTSVVRTLMERRKMSQEALAEIIGMSPASVKKFLTGKNEPREPVVLKIARVLGVTPEAILEYRAADENPEDALYRVWYLVQRYRDEWSEENRRKVAAKLLTKGGAGK